MVVTENIGTQAAISIIKAVVYIYDVITLPVYFLLQQPWNYWACNNKTWAVQIRKGDPSSPIVRAEQADCKEFNDIKTLVDLFRRGLYTNYEKPCFGVREVFGEEEEVQEGGKVFKKLILGDYIWSTGEEVDKRVDKICHGLLALGVKPQMNVVIFAETRLEWMITAQACFRANIAVVTLYATLGEDGIVYGLNETEATHIVTSQDLLPKLQKIISRIPTLTHIIYMESVKKCKTDGFPSPIKVISYSHLEELGQQNPDLVGELPGPDDLAVIMYTSGSTGVPKGVMISQKNLVTTSLGFIAATKDVGPSDLYIAFLPLAHVLELAAECFFLISGVPIGYSSPYTMTDKSTAIKRGGKGDAALLRPTIMNAVPLVLDRIRKGVYDVAYAKGPVFRSFFDFSVAYKQYWMKKGFGTPILDRIVFKKVRDIVGGRLRALASGSAPLAPDTHEFIRACLGCKMIQGYGLTETAAGATLMDVDDYSTGRVGAPLGGKCYIRLVDWDEGGYHVTDKPNPRGEIVIGGDTVTQGYYKNETLTMEAFKEEDGIRWFFSGDIGEICSDGSLKIIDRKKDLVKLQFGEYVSLGKVETELKTCSIVDNICVYGSSFHTYLVALVVPNQKNLMAVAQKLGKSHLSFPELCQDQAIISSVNKSLQEHGVKSNLSKMEIPSKIKLCTEDWVPDNGLVTAAFKLRRKVIQQFYQNDIDNMYGIDTNGVSKSA